MEKIAVLHFIETALASAANGVAYAKTARELGISKQRAHQILTKAGSLGDYHKAISRFYDETIGKELVCARCRDSSRAKLAVDLYKELKETSKLDSAILADFVPWAAGIYEGEGSVNQKDLTLVVVQKDPWILYKLRSKFSGKISYRMRPHTTDEKRSHEIYVWTISGPAAFRFTLLIVPYLSPRRKQQLIKPLWHHIRCNTTGERTLQEKQVLQDMLNLSKEQALSNLVQVDLIHVPKSEIGSVEKKR